MKKQQFSIFRKGIYSTAISVTLLLASYNSALAEVIKDTLQKGDVKYVGKSENYVVFDLSYENFDKKKFTVQLLDKDTQDVIYEKEYHDSVLNRKLYLLVEDANCTVTFKIKQGKKLHQQSFYINKEMKMIDELSVTKL